MNLDIIVMSTIFATLFLVFIIGTYRELKNPSTDVSESGPRADLAKFVGNLFDENSKTKKSSEMFYKSVKRVISDMESDGVYFPPEVKKELEEKRKEMICEYSGLPSVESYSIEPITKQK